MSATLDDNKMKLQLRRVFERVAYLCRMQAKVPFLLFASLVIVPPIMLNGVFNLLVGGLAPAIVKSNNYVVFVGVICFVCLWLLVIYCVAQMHAAICLLDNKTAEFGVCIQRGVRHGLSFLVLVLLGSAAFAIGLICLVIPGILFATKSVVAAPVLVEERLSFTAAFRRSAFLSRNNQRAILVLVLTWMAIVLAARLAVALSVAALSAFGMQQPDIQPPFNLNEFTIVYLVLGVLLTIWSIGVSATYVELRDLRGEAS
jgi:hypothetical protein